MEDLIHLLSGISGGGIVAVVAYFLNREMRAMQRELQSSIDNLKERLREIEVQKHDVWRAEVNVILKNISESLERIERGIQK